MAEPQIKAHLMRAPREDQVRMIGLRSGRAGATDVSVSMMLSPLFPWNPQQETFSEENILFQWLCIRQWRPGYPVGTNNLQISALYMKAYRSVLAHVQRRLHVSIMVLTETRLAEQPPSESGGLCLNLGASVWKQPSTSVQAIKWNPAMSLRRI